MIIGLIFGTLAIFGTFLILTAAFAGIGLILRRGFGFETLNIDDCLLAFWIGYGVVILTLNLWNFFFPVGLSALLFVLAVGGVGIVWNRLTLTRILDAPSWQPDKLICLLLILGALWVANQSIAEFRSWDGALYHLQGIRWVKTYPVIPGIANLHGPLAFNNSSFLYNAMLDSGWWEGRAFHVANGVLVFVFVLQAIAAGARFAQADRWAPSSQLYRFLLLAPALYLAPLDDGVSSYSTDLSLNLILFVATAKLYDILNATQTATTEDAYGLFALSILFATAVCIKLTAGVFAAVAMPLAAWLWWKRRPPEETGLTRTIVWTASAIILFAGSWLARGIVMSGYPFFPLSVAGFSVDWRAPVEHADAELAYNMFTERQFSWTIGRDWLRLVLWHDAYAVLVPACLAVVALVGLYLFRVFQREAHESSRDTWWLLPPVLVAIVTWFMSVPSTRYCPALFWTLAAVCLCEFQRVVWPHLAKSGRLWGTVGFVILGVSPLVVEPVRTAFERGRSPLVAILKHNLVTPGPGPWLHPIPTQVEVTTFNTRSGLILNVPKIQQSSTRQPNSCWDAPIPCTPNPSPNLRLRESGRLDKGFKVEGEWQMQNYPYYWRGKFLPEWRMRRSRTASPR